MSKGDEFDVIDTIFLKGIANPIDIYDVFTNSVTICRAQRY